MITVTIVAALLAVLVVLFGATDRVTTMSDASIEGSRSDVAISSRVFTDRQIDDDQGETSGHVQVADAVAPQSTVAGLQGSEVVSSANSMLSAWMEDEPVDPDWAPQMESLLWGLVSTIGEVLEVQCRTSECRVLVVPSTSDPRELTENRVLIESFQSIIMNSNGRLDGLRFPGTPDARSGITISLFGPRLESGAIDAQ